MDEFDEFDDWMDEINSYPLTSHRIYNYANAIHTNQQIVNNIYNIRRHLELDDAFVGSNDTDESSDSIIENLFMMIFNNQIDSVNNVFTELFTPGDLEDVKVTLTREQFKRFPEIIFTESSSEHNSECNICMEEYVQGDRLTKLDCKHVFHTTCIENWLCKERVTCPVCRKDMRETDVI